MFTRHWVCVCVCVVSDTVPVVQVAQTVPFPAYPTWILLPYLVAGGGATSRAAQDQHSFVSLPVTTSAYLDPVSGTCFHSA